MNMFKKNGGFTLVELIVVIAILAILAGVAVPAYTGYIKKADQAADLTALDAVKTAVQSATASKGEVTKIVIATNNGAITTITVTGGGFASPTDIAADTTTVGKDFDLYLATLPTLKSDLYKSGATWVKVAETGLVAGWNGST